MRLMWFLIGLLALVTITYGSDCPESVLRKVQDTHWVRCNEENQRRMQELEHKRLNNDEPRIEQIRQVCCVLSDTMTCWVDSLRSECGNEAANEMIKTAKFKDDCASWKYPESISQCQLWYSKWWFITIVAILSIAVIASLAFWGLRKRARRSR